MCLCRLFWLLCAEWQRQQIERLVERAEEVAGRMR